MTVKELIEQLKRAPQDKVVRVCSPGGKVGEAEIVSWANSDWELAEPGVRIEVGYGPEPPLVD
jgi:hypothetical protein